MNYNALVRKQALNGTLDDSDSDSDLAPVQVAAKLKSAVLSKLNNVQGENSDSDNEGMVMKKKSAEEIADEERIQKEFEEQQAKRRAQKIEEPLSRYFGDNDKLTKDDKFLKDYILMQGWKSGDKSRSMPTGEGTTRYDHLEDSDDEVFESEDEAEIEAMEEFEHQYNFRYEEPHGDSIEGHVRNLSQLDSVRKRDTKRKEARERRKQREEERKQEKIEEVKRLKNVKKKELVEQLQKIRDAELKQLAEFQNEERIEDDEASTHDDELDTYEEGESDQVWFVCDGCSCVLQPNDNMYECSKGCDFILCKPCHKKNNHPHKLTRSKVPEYANPPEDAEDMVRSRMNNDIDEAEVEKAAYHAASEDLGFEDIIGDMATKFKYRSTKPIDFGLTAEEILLLPDAELDKIMPLNSIATYADAPKRSTVRRRIKAVSLLRERASKGDFEGWWEKNSSKKKKKEEVSDEARKIFDEMEIADDNLIKQAMESVKQDKKNKRSEVSEPLKRTQASDDDEEDEEFTAKRAKSEEGAVVEKEKKNKKKKEGSSYHEKTNKKALKGLSEDRKSAYGLTDKGFMKQKVKSQLEKNH